MKIIITGISRGLGKSLFNLISKEKVDIIAISRSFCDYQIELAENNKNIELIKLDLSDLEAVKNNFVKFNNENIIFINNAAMIEPICKIGEMQSEDIIKAINLNFLVPALLINSLAKNKLSVINISTGAAASAMDNWSLYCSSKAGIEMFLQVFKIQLNEEDGCSVVNIDPGVMDTKMQETIRNSFSEDVTYFRELKEKSLLRDPKLVAEDIFNKYIKDMIKL